ncbi:hypothetical protein F2P45_18705 [Massilia sp. CCM 8733]|uniref:Uncharacterized protein n=1 Tax=Massilia mucilaginosa TaxID=2609282 RepID=A0ABX0NWA0_9BURK|nr:hypothetical protein [Massilia mucilaginosa]NHZ91033.1 hypothetical protein [Massilia mucilaginosa]
MAATDERVVQLTMPGNCTFLVGLPTTREGFNASRALDGRGYATNFLGGWPQYQVQFVDNLRMLSHLAMRLGIDFVEQTDCGALRAAFDNPDRPIVILMSHTSQGAFEMNGKLIDQRQMLNTVPVGFSGVFDIFACEPNELAEELVSTRRDCLIRFLPRNVDPISWLVYFQSVFRLLYIGQHSYLSASEAVTIALINHARRPMKPTKSISDAISAFLTANNQHSAPHQGEPPPIDPRHSATLLDRFDHIQKSNRLSKTLAIGILVGTFLVTLYFAFLYQNDIKSVSFILGGNFLSLLVIAGWLRRIWLEGTTLDILCVLLQNLPPREAVQVLATFYNGTLDRRVG